MAIKVPTESKGQIDKAGEVLISEFPDNVDWAQAMDLADRWRACHAYPIHTFQATLRNNVAKIIIGDDYIVAQRLKRMPTIIDKLKHSPSMHLTTMQDIGGVRAVLPKVKDVYALASIYSAKSRFKHELVKVKDYIKEPRTLDGYRSLHLIYKYRNSQAPEYNNLRVELQIRTKLQHFWATAVETMGTLLGQALKSRRGAVDNDWIDFFALVSSAFAYIEETPRLPRFKDMSYDETAQAISAAEKKLGALAQMRGFFTAVNEIDMDIKKKWSYHLIVLNSIEKTVQITPYNRDSSEQAMLDYSRAEARAAKGEAIEPVLVSAGPIGTLRRAYPNFFLDITEFVAMVEKIIVPPSAEE